MKIEFDPADLKPIIERTIEETLERIQQTGARFGDRLAYSEAEAAGLLGVARHVLADARRRGLITARKIGKEYRYSREGLIEFMRETG